MMADAMWRVAVLALVLACGCPALAQTNAGPSADSPDRPFAATPVASFDTPWAIAFLPDGRLLVTERGGRLFLVTPEGDKREVSPLPEVDADGQLGLLDVAVSPRFATDGLIYLTYAEPGRTGAGLVLARARLVETGGAPRLENAQPIWRQGPQGRRGHPGGIIAFSPDGAHLFLSLGERMRGDGAQNPDAPLGKVLRLLPDGTVPPDNPQAAAGGVRAQTWTTGHRNPYGLAFAPDGRLWLHEMGPRGGDEVNLIAPGQNYGWPEVSNGDTYAGLSIPDHDTRPEFTPPVLYWTPVIAPAGLAFYDGPLFPGWWGSALIGGLRAEALVRVEITPDGAREVDRWPMGARIRDVAVAADGAVWLIEDDARGRLIRLTPAGG